MYDIVEMDKSVKHQGVLVFVVVDCTVHHLSVMSRLETWLSGVCGVLVVSVLIRAIEMTV